MSLIERARMIRRLTAFGAPRETTLGWCRAFVRDVNRLLSAIENDKVKEEIGGNTARLIKLITDQSFLKVAVHEAFPSMKDYGESLNPNPPQEKTEGKEEMFTIKEKNSPVGEYFQN